ncbi:unnamed protein product, partial [Symbiodinium microadriaticum]
MLQRGTLPAWELLGKVAKAAPSLWSPSMSSAPSNARADQVVPSHNNKAAFSPGAPHNRKPRSVDSEPLSEPAERTSASSSSIAGFRQHLRASLSGLSSVFRSPSKRKVGKQRPSHLPTIAASRAVVSMASTAKKLPPPPVSTPAEPPERVAKKQAKEQAKEAFAKSRPIKPRHRKVGKQRPSYLAPVGDIMKLPRPLGPLGANPGTAADPGPASQRQAPVEDRSALSPAETHTQTQAKAESCAPSVPGMSELRPEAADVEARLDVVKAKDQLWGQLSQEGIVRSPCLEGQPEPSPAPSSLSPKKPRTSTGKKRSLDQAAEVPKPPAAPAPSDLPQPTRGLSSIAAKQRMTKQHRPITKRVKLEQAKLEEDNYEISDLEEDLHGNRVEPDRSRKRIPAWCTNYVQTAEMQAEVDPDSIFGSHMPICDLEVIFPDSFYRGSTPIKRRRGSSCNWYRDGLTQREVNAYALKMGQKRSWSTAKSSFTLASSRISKADIPLPPVLAKVKVEAVAGPGAAETGAHTAVARGLPPGTEPPEEPAPLQPLQKPEPSKKARRCCGGRCSRCPGASLLSCCFSWTLTDVKNFLLQIPQVYCETLARRPWAFLLFWAIAILIVLPMMWRPIVVNADIDAFRRADAPAARGQLAYLDSLRFMRAVKNESALSQRTMLKVEILYEAKDGSVFSESVLRDIRAFEQSLRSLAGWAALCNMSEPALQFHCNPGDSMGNYVWPRRLDDFLNAQGFFRLAFDGSALERLPMDAVIAYLREGLAAPHDLRMFLPMTFAEPSSGSKMLRSVFGFAAPDLNDTLFREAFQDFVQNELYSSLLQAVMDTRKPVDPSSWDQPPAIRIYFRGDMLDEHELLEALYSDMLLAIGPLFISLVVAWVKLRSALLAFVGTMFLCLAALLAYIILPVEE